MLTLSRKKGEKIVIGDNIVVMVVEVRSDRVRIGVDAPREFDIRRSELAESNGETEWKPLSKPASA